MTPFEQQQLAQEQIEQQDTAAFNRYLDGSEDAAFGQLPRYTDTAYLMGYVAKLKELPTNPDGTIQHYSPRQHFAYGMVDSPDPCDCGEF
ncbi:hypothetical protein [Egbenema bharatensis]|uniref:hypothetical protein n=1 Tax=Egbenema bharatensis TaxID=3463334 RepID=UPI003A851836